MARLEITTQNSYGCIRVVDHEQSRVFIRNPVRGQWESYLVEDGLEIFQGYLEPQSAGRLDTAIGVLQGPVRDFFLYRNYHQIVGVVGVSA